MTQLENVELLLEDVMTAASALEAKGIEVHSLILQIDRTPDGTCPSSITSALGAVFGIVQAMACGLADRMNPRT